MADLYDEMANVARELLAPTNEGGMGQGLIQLVRLVPGPPPVNPWDPPSDPVPEKTTLDGAASGVGKELIGAPVESGGQIVASDIQVIVAPWGGTYEPGDVLELDGMPVTILKISNIPAVGTVCAIKFVVRG